jgi:Cytochrome P460
MSQPIQSTRVLPMAVSVMLVLASNAMAQGSGSSRATPSPPRQPTVEEFANSFWQFINRPESPYQKWQTVESDVPPGVTDEHHASRKIYLNSVAGKDRDKLPVGSILIRPQYGANGKELQNINVMYRIKGSDSDKLEWYWLRYLPNGSIAKTTGTSGDHPTAGQVRSCIECHQKAPSGELTFPMMGSAADAKK